MQSIRIRTAAGLLLGACAIYGLPAVAADNADAGASDSAAQSQSQDFTDKQLKQFVEAQNNVQAVLKKWDSKVAEADDKEAAQRKENKAMLQAVKDSGLSPKQYNNIARAAQNDPKLTKRIQSFMTPE
ncbi:DUF4168 domain-containing protein [Salinisphaera sp. SPP-AMP-43]|uniref:DUF4168 domain-containing protein n=1 Tax=Salinisphaera sp. SPP-AMP-43 TaxID=3121288 RepID=UPI003C6E52BF